MNLQLNNQPFEKLRICYFRAFDKPGEEIFLDCTDEQILAFLVKKYCETVHIQRIEEVEVLNVVTHYPSKKKLAVEELKFGKTNEEIAAYAEKVKGFQKKYK